MSSSFTAVKIDIDSDVAKVVIDSIKTSARKYRRLYRERIKELAENTIKELQVTPPKPKYPIQWKTEKQRRAFFATNGFGKGIPTKRTGNLVRGWNYELISDYTNGLFYIYNDAVTRNYFTGDFVFYEQFVTGIHQQPFHKNTGWIQSQDVLADTLLKAEDILIETWYEVNEAK